MKFHFFKVNNKKKNNKVELNNILTRILERVRQNIIMLLVVALALVLLRLGYGKFLDFKDRNKAEEVQEEEVYIEPTIPKTIDKPIVTFDNIDQYKDFDNLLKFVYAVDESAYIMEDDLQIDKFLEADFKTQITDDPKILIFHTHSQEDFIDSRAGESDDTIVGVGRILAKILVEEYGVNVVHDVGQYDVIDGKVQRGGSYEVMEQAELKLLEKYPTIEIAIDLHRDGIENGKFLTSINGKDTARIMFFNGISRLNSKGAPKELTELSNPYLDKNLAFSFQMFLTANEKYPDLCRRNYIKPYRYSLHMLQKSLLVEVGANTNTVDEAKNAMYPLAEILMAVIS